MTAPVYTTAPPDRGDTTDSAAATTRSGPHPLRLPVSARVARFLVLAAVFVCAACGLVYELALVALGSYLFGDSVTQAAIVLSVMVFAMGIGSLAAKPLQRWPATAFAVVECLLALVGGLSVLLLYSAFAWLGLYRPALVVVAFGVGALIGAEIPLLMTLIQRIRRQDAGSATADLFAADYIGALLGGLAFPFVLLPFFGQLRGALAVGAVNVVAGVAVVLWLFRSDLTRAVRTSVVAGAVLVLAVLTGAYGLADRFEVTARQALFDAPVVHAERTPYQQITLTRSVSLAGEPDLRLFLNGDLQFSSVDEYRYHEALVHPAMTGEHRSVLVLGGGDGLALREVLRYPDAERVVQVELDPAMVRLARTDEALSQLNGAAFEDPRVEVVTADAFGWLREHRETFDVVIADLPDADSVATAKLYSVEFYGLVRQVLTPGGRLVVQAGSPYFASEAFWSIDAAVRTAGLSTVPYHVDVPSFGDWGFLLAAESQPQLRLDTGTPSLRFLDTAVLEAATVFPADRRQVDVEASTLLDPTILEYARRGWQHY